MKVSRKMEEFTPTLTSQELTDVLLTEQIVNAGQVVLEAYGPLAQVRLTMTLDHSGAPEWMGQVMTFGGRLFSVRAYHPVEALRRLAARATLQTAVAV